MLANSKWQNVSWRNGTKGRLKARFAAVRVRTADGPPQRIKDMGQQHLPGDEAWLIGEHRTSGEKKYYLANLPAGADLPTLAGRIKARWICEQAHQQLKEELGLDHFEGRSWQGLHRHALMTMIAYAFLQHRRLAQTARKKRINGPPPQPSLPAVRNSSFDRRRSDARTAENKSANSNGVKQRPHPWHVRAGGGAVHSIRTGPHTPFYEESDATRAARLFRLAYGRRLRCLLKAHSGVGPDAPEHDLVPVMAWRGFVPAHGSRDARYATIARRSCSSRLATTWAINGLHSPVRAPCWKS